MKEKDSFISFLYENRLKMILFGSRKRACPNVN